MIAREVVQEIMVGEDLWWATKGEPKIESIGPSEHYKYDAADLVSLILPAPCEVAFEAPASDGAMRLMLGAGVDAEVGKLFAPKNPGRFEFVVTRNGEVAFKTVIEVHKEKAFEELIWRRPEGGGVDCKGGDQFTLRTRMLAPEVPEGYNFQPKIGFCELRFERTKEIERQESSEDAPNIILIVQDTMRDDRTTMAGYGKDITPNLRKLAERGTRYSAAHATSSWTWPSTASLLTGLLPDAHSVVSNESCYLPNATDTLAEVLQLRGYTTGAFTRNPLITPDKGFAQGFEVFDSKHEFVKTGEFLPAINTWLDKQEDNRFFLYLHLADAHGPLEALPGELDRLGLKGIPSLDSDAIEKRIGKINKDLFYVKDYDARKGFDEAFGENGLGQVVEVYDGGVASGDYYLGEILKRVESLGLTGKTIVAFTSDHGEEWLEHGMIRHSQGLHKELVQVPMVIAGPGFEAGKVMDNVVSNRQLAHTLALFGGGVLDDISNPIDLSVLDTMTPEEVGPVFFSTHHGFWKGERHKKIYGVRHGDWMLHFGQELEADGKTETFGWRLFNVADDPEELVELSDSYPEKVNELRKLIEDSLAAQLEMAKQNTGDLRVSAAGSTLKMLGDIGYLDGLDSK
ncbi:MAG: sulfatase [Planctomycetota bacterium]|nr:sulfatase [Planctomycetota bacterium]MDG2142779.1 sulfatase [Planctomycetota bacterium]